jgi:hypothetical protein
MKKRILLLFLLFSGCISQKVYYDSYDKGWYIRTETKNYVREYWYTNQEMTGKYLQWERRLAEYFKEQMK